MSTSTDLHGAKEELFRLGIDLVIVPGQFRVNFRKGTEATAFYSDDLEEAAAAGRKMAAEKAAEPAPMGPLGRRNSRRGQMLKHNAKIAGRRRRAAKKKT